MLSSIDVFGFSISRCNSATVRHKQDFESCVYAFEITYPHFLHCIAN